MPHDFENGFPGAPPTIRLLAFPLVAHCLVACLSAPSTPASQPRKAAPSLRTFLQREVEVNGLPSLVVVVADGERALASEAIGIASRHDKRAADLDTYYRIGSVTKLFTGTVLMILRDQGRLGLDDPVSKFILEIDGVVHPKGDATAITIRHLLSHRSGLQRECPPSVKRRPDSPMTEQDILAGLKGQALLHVPGTMELYSNQAMSLVGVLVSRAAGMSLRDVMQRSLFTPLGIGCVWDDSAVPRGRLADGYELGGDDARPGKRTMGGADEADGGLYCTARDLVRFAQLFLRGGAAGERVLKETSRQQAMRERINWGCSSKSPLGRACGHSGLIDDYAADLHLFLDHGRAVVTLTNAAAAEAISAINRKVAAGLLTRTAWRQLETPEQPVFPEAAGRHLQSLLSEPPTPELVRAHIAADQLKIVGGAEVMAKLLQDALELPPDGRAALTGSLIDSLDETVEPEAEQA